jgi:hypothetical protein
MVPESFRDDGGEAEREAMWPRRRTVSRGSLTKISTRETTKEDIL